jgi:hypothetical protein
LTAKIYDRQERFKEMDNDSLIKGAFIDEPRKLPSLNLKYGCTIVVPIF